LYESVDSGSKACVYVRSGELGAPWYYVDLCLLQERHARDTAVDANWI